MERRLFKFSTYAKVELIESVKILLTLLAVAVLANGFLLGILLEYVNTNG